MTNQSLWLTGDPEADALLSSDDNALLIGMVLDQQVPMEKAFSGPLVIAQRMGGRLDVTQIAAMSEDEFIELCSQRPAIHRFPAAMAKRIRQVCQVLTEDYDGQATNVWKDARSGAEVKANLGRLPGFGPDKAAIFTAVLGKLRGITPEGWRTAAGYYGEPGTFRSVADIVDSDSLQKVRETKKDVKAAKKKASADTDPVVRAGQ
jgi:uncharacterized HhH-GPD family protein